MCDRYSHDELVQFAFSCLRSEKTEKYDELEIHLQECDDCLIIFGYALAIEGKICDAHPFFQSFNLVYHDFQVGRFHGVAIVKNINALETLARTALKALRAVAGLAAEMSKEFNDEKQKQRIIRIMNEIIEAQKELCKSDFRKDAIVDMVDDFRKAIAKNFPQMKFIQSILTFASLQIPVARKILIIPTGEKELKMTQIAASEMDKTLKEIGKVLDRISKRSKF